MAPRQCAEPARRALADREVGSLGCFSETYPVGSTVYAHLMAQWATPARDSNRPVYRATPYAGHAVPCDNSRKFQAGAHNALPRSPAELRERKLGRRDSARTNLCKELYGMFVSDVMPDTVG